MSRWCALASLLCSLWATSARADEFASHCERGRVLFQAEMFAEALHEWKAAYAERQEPRLLYDLGRAYQKLGRAHDASVLFRRYLIAEPTLDEATRGEVEARLSLLARVREAPPSAPDTPPVPTGAELVPVRFEQRAHRGLLVGGIVLLAAGYLPSLIIGSIGLACCVGSSSSGDAPFSSTSTAVLLIPVLGPIVSAAIVRDAVWSLPWLFDGLGQVAGLAMIIAAARNPERVPIFGRRLTLLPYATPRGGGLSAVGSF